MAERANCPICASANIQLFLHRERVPVQQNNLYHSEKEALNCALGDLQMSFCENCGFVFNRAFDPQLMQYSASYNNTQEASGHFVAHLEQMKNRLIASGVKNAKIVEAGCGKGFFLKALIADPKFENTGIGFDPAYEGEESLFAGRLRFVKKYFDHSCVDIEPDTLICRHVIEHVNEPVEFLREIAMALRSSHGCRLFFETPCIDWIFRTRTIWDFFYEHCSIFSAQSLKFLFEKTGFSVKKVEAVFSDQYLWLEAENRQPALPVPAAPETTAHLLTAFKSSAQQQNQSWQELLQKRSKKGPILVWGAGAKGVTFANLFDRERRHIEALIDVNPDKQGRFIPATAHPVIGPAGLKDLKEATIIVMNPNYRGEISALLQRQGLNAELITEPGENK